MWVEDNRRLEHPSPLMTDAPYTTLPQWPHAYPASGASATLKSLNEDFTVTELPLQLPSGEGEHIWLDIEKNGANTAFVAQQLAEAAGVQERDVGYAGLKDRHAITRQWFSIYLPSGKTGETPDLTQLQHPEFRVLGQSRHVKKLRPGDLQGNRFRSVLRDVTGDPGAIEAIEANLKAIAAQGVPNYFGAQRFGFDGGNVEQGRAMLAREIRVRNPKKKGIYLSAVRSFVFNEVLALRIQQGLWGQTLPGDVMDEAGRPTGPLWGRGRVTTTDHDHIKLLGIQHARLTGHRRHHRQRSGCHIFEQPFILQVRSLLRQSVRNRSATKSPPPRYYDRRALGLHRSSSHTKLFREAK